MAGGDLQMYSEPNHKIIFKEGTPSSEKDYLIWIMDSKWQAFTWFHQGINIIPTFTLILWFIILASSDSFT